MKIRFGKFTASVAVAAFGGPLLWAGVAHADGWPASIAGQWSAFANNTDGVMVIDQPPSPRQCKPITGTILGATLQGFYCPGSGRVTFHRYLPGAPPATAYQFYAANLSTAVKGAPLRMGGSVATRSDIEPPGEASFYAIKK